MKFFNLFEGESFKRGFSWMLGLFLGLAILVLVGAFFFLIFHPKLPVLSHYLTSVQSQTNLSEKDLSLISKGLSRGIISPPQELVSQLVAFYDTVIAFLLGIIAVSGIFGYIFIKVKTSQEIREMISKEVATYTDTISFQGHISNLVQNLDVINTIEESIDDVQRMQKELIKKEEQTDDAIKLPKVTEPTSQDAPIQEED